MKDNERICRGCQQPMISDDEMQEGLRILLAKVVLVAGLVWLVAVGVWMVRMII